MSLQRQVPLGRNQGVSKCSINFLVGILQPVVCVTQGQPGKGTEPAIEFIHYQGTMNDKPLNSPELQRKIPVKIVILDGFRE